MDKLPSEILHEVFTLLDFKQKLACLTVCRSWWRVQDERSLFYNIKIFRDSDRLRSLNIRLDKLEEIHENMPSLEDLNLKRIRLEAGAIPSDILPAISITKLHINITSIDNTTTHTLSFINTCLKNKPT